MDHYKVGKETPMSLPLPLTFFLPLSTDLFSVFTQLRVSNQSQTFFSKDFPERVGKAQAKDISTMFPVSSRAEEKALSWCSEQGITPI